MHLNKDIWAIALEKTYGSCVKDKTSFFLINVSAYGESAILWPEISPSVYALLSSAGCTLWELGMGLIEYRFGGSIDTFL